MKPFQVLSILLAFTFFCTFPANADNLYASIRGTVTDPTGAVVSGAKLTATNAGTGILYSTTSNSSGAFTFLQLPIGDYTLKAEQTGFKAYQASGIHLDLDQVYNLPVKLTLGAATEQIVVEANPVQVEQTDMQLGTTISGQTIVDMPLNGRNWTQLQQLEPGIIGTSDRFGGASGAYSGNGAETQQNSFLINGVDSNDASLNTALVIPSPDAIGEFRLITSTINPEYGRNSGTIINANIKNGTNQFHGSAFEFYRDTFLDAANYFENGCEKPDCRSPFHQNEYGATIGGPIYKDHAFFFFSYQGYHQKIPQAANNAVPVFTDAERGGDFSATDAGALSGAKIPFAMFGDNISTCPVSGGVRCDPTLATSTYANLFSTGVIPLADASGTAVDADPLALKLMNQFVPHATSGGNIFNFNPHTTGTYDQYVYRVDEKLTNRDALWFYGLYQTNPTVDTLPFTGSTLPGMSEQAQRHYQQYSVSWTHTFTPTTLNELRIAYLRFNFAAVEPVAPINPTTYGFTGIVPQVPSSASLPVMAVGGLFTLGFSANGPQPRLQNNYQGIDNFSKVWGHHTIKAGVNYDRVTLNNPFFNNLGGNFAYNGSGQFSSGDPGVDFLLGVPDTYVQGSGSIVAAQAHEVYAYVQDQWQIRPNLTITYGTGYDVQTPWYNAYGNGEIMGAFRPGQQSTVFPSAPVGFVYPGDTGINKYGGMTVKYNHLAPRFGFAWSPGASRNFSVHGGIGLYYNRSEEELALQTLTNAPFALTSSGAGPATPCGSPAFATPFIGVNNSVAPCNALVGGANPFPFTVPAKGSSPDFTPYEPIGLSFNTSDPKLTAPRSVNFNLTIERQLDKATILSVAYVGNRGRHEEGAVNLNEAGQFPGVNPVAAAFNGGTCIAYLFDGTDPASCPQTPLGSPQVPGATPFNLSVYGHPGQQATEWNSRYDSMQLTLNRRFSNGLQVLAAYTWSRYFDQTASLENSAFNFPGINPFSSATQWAPSVNDAPQRFVISYNYTLPIYKLTHKWKALTDDWNLVGIYTLQHGTPIPVFDLGGSSLTCDLNVSFYACPDRASFSGAPIGITDPRNNPKHLWFNPAAFTTPTLQLLNGQPATFGTLGTANRNPLYGPGINYGDMAIEKRIHIDESRYFELRFETYNTFNHTNFSNPGNFGSSEDASGLIGNLGRIFSTKTITTNGEGRAVQLGAKFYF
jgi:hypothetical protein